jgi:hypothetical protein
MVSQTWNPTTSAEDPLDTVMQYVTVSPKTAVDSLSDLDSEIPDICVGVSVGVNIGVFVYDIVGVSVIVFVGVRLTVRVGEIVNVAVLVGVIVKVGLQ